MKLSIKPVSIGLG